MKKIQLMSLLTALLLVFGFSASRAQTSPETKNTFSRGGCLPGYSGCVTDNVTIALKSNLFGGASTYTSVANSSFDAATYLNNIKVNSGNFHPLPTASSPVLVIDATEIYPYTVFITRTAANTYTVEVAKNVE